MQITKNEYPLWLLMHLAFDYNRKEQYESFREFPKFGANDNKYHDRIECDLYVPQRISIGYLCQYVLKATIGEDGLIRCEPWTKEQLEKGGYAVLDDLESWHEKGIEFVGKVNEFLVSKGIETTEQHNEVVAV